MAMSREVKKAMILAAGEGTRLRPLTLETPKVLLPVGGVPLIEYTLTWLKHYGISEVIINLHHLGEKIVALLDNGSRLGLKISYSWEETILGTAGGVKKAEPFFDDTFVVVYGDVLTTFDLGAMLRFHREKDSLATIALARFPNPWEVGIVEINAEGSILSITEKPPPGSGKGNLANGGIYILESGIFDYLAHGQFSDFAYDVFPRLIELNLPIYGYQLKPEDYLVDIGTIERYHQAGEDVKSGKVEVKHEEPSRLP